MADNPESFNGSESQDSRQRVEVAQERANLIDEINIKAGPVTMKHSEDGMEVPQQSPRYSKDNVFSKRESDPMMEKKSGSM